MQDKQVFDLDHEGFYFDMLCNFVKSEYKYIMFHTKIHIHSRDLSV